MTKTFLKGVAGSHGGVKVAQVDVRSYWSDLTVDILEVSEDSTSGDGCKTVKVTGQCVDVDWWDGLDDEFLDLVVKTLHFSKPAELIFVSLRSFEVGVSIHAGVVWYFGAFRHFTSIGGASNSTVFGNGL